MKLRLAFLLAGTMYATAALAQSGGGGGAAGGAPGSAPSGTAGVSPSTSIPNPGMPGVPGPATGAGLPGGPGPSTITVTPNAPVMPQTGPTVGRDSGGNIGSPSPNANSSGPLNNANGGRNAATRATTSPTPDFNPEAVTDGGLTLASEDIRAMPAYELRDLVSLLQACTVNGHPTPRIGKCGEADRQYRTRYGKERRIDFTLAELSRVARFQTMLKAAGPINTEYEDRINDHLHKETKTSLALAGEKSPEATRPLNTRDVSMPSR